GTYTRQALAQELKNQINSNSELAGRSVSVTVQNDNLVITSAAYGLASEVTIVSGTALSPLGFAGTESDKGQDVAGNFIVGGTAEPAHGTGQFLIGDLTNPNTADLRVRVALSAAQLGDGPEASLVVTRGVAAKLDRVF